MSFPYIYRPQPLADAESEYIQHHDQITGQWFNDLPGTLNHEWYAALLQQLYIAAIGDWNLGAEKMIPDVIVVLAILELILTLQSYLELGRVKVTLDWMRPWSF